VTQVISDSRRIGYRSCAGENATRTITSETTSHAPEEEAFMFSRQITMQIKKNWTPEFPKVFEKEVLPLLRRQKGFLDELILLSPNKTEVVAISLWETKEFAEIYNREFYPEVVKIINKYLEGLPVVKTFEVEYATLPAFKKLVTVCAN
jgi:hypothetical protein